MNKRVVTAVLHSLLAVVTLASFVWLAYKNAVPSGVVEYVQDFEHRTPFVSDLWPPERFDPVVRGNDGVVRPVVESPVSFFIHPPRKFATSTIQITYKLKDTALFEVAIETGEEADEYKLYPWQSLESLPGDWWRGTIVVPMNDWWRDGNGRYHAELHVSDLLENNNVLWLKEIRVRLESLTGRASAGPGRPQGWAAWREAFS